jgi:hypothetical protein
MGMQPTPLSHALLPPVISVVLHTARTLYIQQQHIHGIWTVLQGASHLVVHGNAADALEPGGCVLEADVDVLNEAGGGDGAARGNGQQVRRAHRAHRHLQCVCVTSAAAVAAVVVAAAVMVATAVAVAMRRRRRVSMHGANCSFGVGLTAKSVCE